MLLHLFHQLHQVRIALFEPSTNPLAPRAREIFNDHMRQSHQRIDRMFVALMCLQWVFAMICAVWLSPVTWSGTEWSLHPHVWLAAILGGMLTLPAAYVGVFQSGSSISRHVIALCQVGFSTLLIHVTGGRIETHFHVFGSLAFLAAYRDWRVLMPATVFVAVDHLVRGMFWPETVFGVTTASNWRWLEHAGWVLFEDLWLITCCRQGMREVQDIARHQANSEDSHSALTKQTVALEEALQERSAIFAGALDAIVQMDGTGHITGWNSQAAEVFGWSADEALGRPLAETIVPPDSRQHHQDGLRRYLTTGMTKVLNRRIEVDAIRREGTVIPIELAITAIHSAERVTFCAFLRDISERRQAEERLKLAKESAEAANHAKSLFLANMSHEIRTPLNAILGFTDLMRTGDEPPLEERRSYLEAVHKSGTHLLAVINDVLDLSKIEAGQMQYERIRFSPHQVMVDVLSLMRVRAGEKGLTLDARWLGRVPESIESDPARLRQLLLNLVGNAIKFTEQGSIQLLARVNSSKQLLQVEVIDTGVGIPTDKLEEIFAPFIQADISVTRKFGGTGLGLSICRHIAEALGGHITAQSCEGQGSTFVVTLATGSLAGIRMLEAPPTEILRGTDTTASGPRLRLDGLQVLVVDDGETNRRLLKLLLSRAGAHVTTAEHGRAAVEQATKTHFDVILMDMQMPILDGYSATRELRTREIDTHIVALTAHAMSGDKEKCCRAGCNDYLTKPVSEQELFAILARIQRSSTVSSSPERADVSRDHGLFTSEIDLADEEIRDIVCEFIGRLDDYCKELETAWSVRNWQALADRSHAIKGTSAMIGLASLSDCASALEDLALRQVESEIPVALREFVTLSQRVVGAVSETFPIVAATA